MAMSAIASSHVAGVSTPSLRISGVNSRSGLYWVCKYCPVRWHKNPWVIGWSGSPRSRVTRPSSTVAIMLHASGQSRLQVVFRFCMAPRAGSWWWGRGGTVTVADLDR